MMCFMCSNWWIFIRGRVSIVSCKSLGPVKPFASKQTRYCGSPISSTQSPTSAATHLLTSTSDTSSAVTLARSSATRDTCFCAKAKNSSNVMRLLPSWSACAKMKASYVFSSIPSIPQSISGLASPCWISSRDSKPSPDVSIASNIARTLDTSASTGVRSAVTISQNSWNVTCWSPFVSAAVQSRWTVVARSSPHPSQSTSELLRPRYSSPKLRMASPETSSVMKSSLSLCSLYAAIPQRLLLPCFAPWLQLRTARLETREQS
mmetsp:Transcript_26582/g.87140  ORF Transcript_26582/g.87140 Transcript_26582/m.87140 type:complete len:263 (-) Transcript_26582:5-793(-)